MSDSKSEINFSTELELSINRAIVDSERRGQKFATVENLLLAIVDDPDASEVMVACGVDLDEIRSVLDSYIEENITVKEKNEETEVSDGFQRVVQRAILHGQTSGKIEINGANLLVALFSERDSFAVYFLQQQDISRLDAVSYISHGIGKDGYRMPEKPPPPPDLEKDFFISYSASDENIAREVDEVLRAFGYSTVVQFRDFSVGSNFVKEMQKALDSSLRLIAIYSKEYFSSGHCQAEWNCAYGADPTGERRKIIPFLIEPTELSPLARQVVYMSLVGMDRRERAAAIYKGPI